MQKQHNVNDNIHGLVRCTSLENMIMGQAIFNRLHNVYQNSVAYLTWPTNRNQRFEHSVGTMKLAGDMFYHSIENSESSIREKFLSLFTDEIKRALNIPREDINTFFSSCESAARRPYHEWDNSFSIESNEEIAQLLSCEINSCKLPDYADFLVPSNVSDKHKATCYMLAQTVRVVGMLHDVGHPPFSHAVEHAIGKLLDDYDVESAQGDALRSPCEVNPRAQEFVNSMRKYKDGEAKIHENIGRDLTELLFKSILNKLRESDAARREGHPFVPLMVEYYVIYKFVLKTFSDEGPFAELHRIVDATVDADRLDFVKRDNVSSGLSSGNVQYSQIIGGMKLCEMKNPDQNETAMHFAFSSKSVVSIELFLKQRYQNYDTVVFHHRVIKTEVLLNEIVQTLGKRYIEEAHSTGPSETPSGCQRQLASDISGLWQPFVQSRQMGDKASMHLFGQWNDAWFITMLTGKYVELCLLEEEGRESKEDRLLREQLAELLYSEKHYISIIKRFEDLTTISKYFYKQFEEQEIDPESIRTRLRKCKEPSSSGGEDNDEKSKSIGFGIDVDASIDAFELLLPSLDKIKTNTGQKTSDTKNGVISGSKNPFVLIRKEYAAYAIAEKNHRDFVSLIKSFVESYFKNRPEGEVHFIVEKRNLNPGINPEINPGTLIYNANGVFSFIDVSNATQAIALEERYRPPLYVFVNDHTRASIGSDQEYREKLLQHIASELFNWYNTQLGSFLKKVEEKASEMGLTPAISQEEK